MKEAPPLWFLKSACSHVREEDTDPAIANMNLSRVSVPTVTTITVQGPSDTTTSTCNEYNEKKSLLTAKVGFGCAPVQTFTSKHWSYEMASFSWTFIVSSILFMSVMIWSMYVLTTACCRSSELVKYVYSLSHFGKGKYWAVLVVGYCRILYTAQEVRVVKKLSELGISCMAKKLAAYNLLNARLGV